jgi:hypothetical protein
VCSHRGQKRAVKKSRSIDFDLVINSPHMPFQNDQRDTKKGPARHILPHDGHPWAIILQKRLQNALQGVPRSRKIEKSQDF